MKKRNFLVGFLFGILFFFNGLIPIVSAIEKSEHLYQGDYSSFAPVCEEGDKIYWRFKTHNDEFKVLLEIKGDVISESKTSDSGIYDVLTNGSCALFFSNYDYEWYRDGWIDIEISINIPLSNDFVPNDPAPVSLFEDSVILYYGGGDFLTSYNPVFEEGDKIYWRFKTHDDEFNVKFTLGGEVLTEYNTSDSGIYDVLTNGSYPIFFMNNDYEYFRDGWIDIEISINIPLIQSKHSTHPRVLTRSQFFRYSFGIIVDDSYRY